MMSDRLNIFRAAYRNLDLLPLTDPNELKKFRVEDPKAQAFLDLLHGLHILEYRNAEVWYDVHPIVEDLLKRKGLD
jgi:hypothetical protein